MLFLFFLVVAGATGGLEQKAVVSEEQPYRLLYSQTPATTSPLRDFGYVVSVEGFLDRPEVEKLICQIVLKEKPEAASRLSISIYYELDKYAPTGGLPEPNLRDHLVASYIWNAKIAGARNRLVLVRDATGKLFSPPQNSDFDHTKSCQR